MIDFESLRAEAAVHSYPLLFATISGAHLYGFPSADSDFDLRGAHILPIGEVAGLLPKRETVESSGWRNGLEIDLVTHDAAKFLAMMLKRNGYVLEQLHSPLIVTTSPAHEELRHIAHSCVTRHHSHHYLGFAATQWGMFSKEDPPRVKPLLYLYRVLLTGIHLMRTGEVEANILNLNREFRLPYIEELVERKRAGKEHGVLTGHERGFHAAEYLQLVSLLEEANQLSALPDEPSALPALNDLLIRIRLKDRG